MNHAQLITHILRAIQARELGVAQGSKWSPGFPDLVIAGPGGVIFREIKTATGRLEDAQWEWSFKLIKSGADWAVWRPCDWPEQIETQLGRLAKV